MNSAEKKEYHRQWMKRWRTANLERAKQIARKNYAKYAEAKREEARRRRSERKNDPVKLQAYRDYCRKKTSERLRKDPNFKLRFRLRGRISMALKRGACPKSEGTEELIGCSMAQFRKHIESKWLPGMSWENYGRGGWHIDHIIPCEAFDLTKLTEREKCFHYSNAQPLWQRDNLSKGARRHRQMWLNLSEPL